MNEIKTLKDCKDLEEAREEIIKWIKRDLKILQDGEIFIDKILNLGRNITWIGKLPNMKEERLMAGVMRFIQFFGITRGDLNG